MKKIAVVGSSGADEKMTGIAEDIGKEIAKQDAILLIGEYVGIMESAARGAKGESGTVIGIMQKDREEDAKFIDIQITTGIGRLRSDIMINSSDGVIAIGGSAGTLKEIAYAYKIGKPIVVIKGSGGWADRLADKYLDEKETVRIAGAETAKEAVDIIIREINAHGKG